MTDYFALLDQPRVPWLDPTALKEVFHRKSLEQHPDATRGAEGEFAELNQAYQVLQDPKQRLHHLLLLADRVPSANQAAPPDLEELFLQIGALNQGTSQLLAKMRATSNPLSKSLLQPEIVSAKKKMATLREKLRDLTDASEDQLRQVGAGQLNEISDLYQRFAYLGRWSAQLDELAFQLSL